jgi:putative ABC transport system permease protein
MWRILFAEFLGDLRTQKTRALLTMFAVTWGTVAVVVLLAFGEGLKTALSTGLLNAGDRLYMVYGGTTSKEWEGLPTGRSIRLTEEDLALLLRSIPEIELGSPSYGRWGTSLRWGESKTTTYMEGIYPSFAEMRRMFARPGGRFLNEDDLTQRRRVIFLGNEIAERVFGDTEPVGQSLILDGLPFTVIGVMQKKFQDSSNNGPDADRAIIPASTMKAIYGYRSANHLLIRPRDEKEAVYVKQRLFEVLGGRYRFDPTDERALPMWDFIEDQKMVDAIGLGIQIFLGLVGAFTLLVAGVGVANIMYVVVRERTREIGIKLAVGARRRHIMAQFVFEAMLIAFIGGAAGLIVSAGAVGLVNAIPADDPAMQYIANPTLSWPIALVCVSILIAIGLAAGILPARRAAAVDPIESLRYE